MRDKSIRFPRSVNPGDRDHDGLTPGRLHSADIEPAGNRVDHVLVINGLAAGRFTELQKALAARRLVINQVDDRDRDNQEGLIL